MVHLSTEDQHLPDNNPQAIDALRRSLDELAAKQKTTGVVFWRARDLMSVLGYARWENFYNVIQKAMEGCGASGLVVSHQFRETTKMVAVGSGATNRVADFFLTRYACYLIAMNGDSGKQEIAYAQTYFAVQARRQEIDDQLTEEEKRIQ